LNKKKSTKDNNETKMLNTRLSRALIKRIKFYCADKEITIQDFMNQAVEEKLKSSGF